MPMRALVLAILVLTIFALSPRSALPQEPQTAQELRAAVAAREEQIARQAEIFLDRRRPTAERASAVSGVPVFIRSEHLQAAARLALDSLESPQLRALGVSRGLHAFLSDTTLFSALLPLLEGRDTSTELRLPILEAVEVAMTGSLVMHTHHERIMSALRAVSQSRDPEVRIRALRLLAIHDDNVTRRLMLEWLSSPESPIPRHEIVVLLGLRLNPESLPALHRVMLLSDDSTTRIETIRLVGSYRESRPVIARWFQDPRQSETVRLAAAGALYAADPDAFPGLALSIVQDEAAGDALRTYIIQAVRYRRLAMTPAEAGAGGDSFDRAISGLARNSQSAVVRSSAVEYAQDRGLPTRD